MRFDKLAPATGLCVALICGSAITAQPGPGSVKIIYVAQNGSASGDGTLAHPYATIDQARAHLASLHIRQNAAKYAGQDFVVEIEKGTYGVSSPILFTKDDSGTSTTHITYRNYGTDQVVISGGMSLKGWQQVSGSANLWQITFTTPPQYFENMWLNEKRLLRPRLGGGMLGSYNRVFQTYYTTPTNDKNCGPSGPNSKRYECFDRFKYNASGSPGDPTVLHPEAWGNVVPSTNAPCTLNVVKQDIEVLVFEQFSTSKLRVKCIDTNAGVVYMTGPTPVPGATNAHEAGFITQNRMIIENVKSALTSPGQWFLDRSKAQWTLTYFGDTGEKPNNEEFVIPQASQLVVATDLQYVTFEGLAFEYDNYTVPQEGHPSSELEIDVPSALSFQNAQHIMLTGITVRHTSGGGVDFTSCLLQYQPGGGTPPNPASPAWCKVFEKTGVAANDKILDSTFYDLGAHGIRIGQNSHGALDTLFDNDNSPNHNLVSNNVVEGYGRVIPAAFGIAQGVGHDNQFRNNEVYDGYHVAISISHGGSATTMPTGAANSDLKGNFNNTIADNHVHDLFQGIMNDGGSIRIEAGNDVFSSPGNKITGNIVHDTSDSSVMDTGQNGGRRGYGGNGIYLDNSTGRVEVENNLVYRVSDFAVYSPHGPALAGEPNIVRNNILAFARNGMISVHDPYEAQTGPSYPSRQAFIVEHNIMYFDRTSAMDPAFHAAAGCRFAGVLFQAYPSPHVVSPPFTGFELFRNNLYWRVPDGAFAQDSNAFVVEQIVLNSDGGPTPSPSPGPWPVASTAATAPVIDDPCGNRADKREVRPMVQKSTYDLADWKRVQHEDEGSISQDPQFKNAGGDKPDDYSLPNGSPGVGFVVFPLTAGRTGHPPEPPSVEPTFPTKTFLPSDF